MSDFDLIIRGGTVFDGLRTPRYRSDVGIENGRIAYIGPLEGAKADRVIEAEGLHVAPGFVDLHTHYDSQIYWDPYCTLSGWHGVTSVVIGNCGFGFAPCKVEDRDRAMLTMERNEAVPLAAMREGMAWDWETFPEFLDSLERTPKGLNILAYVGLNPIFMYVMGVEAAKSRRPTASELDQMKQLLREAMDAGACGFSAQLLGDFSMQRDYDGTPMITDTMANEDLLAFAEVLAEIRRGFIQVSGSSPHLSEKVAAVSGRPVIWNLLAVGADQHGMPTEAHEGVIQWLDDANARGRRIFAQALTVDAGFTFTFEDWNLFDNSPLWREATLGSPAERAVKFADPERRVALRDEYDAGRSPVAGGGTEEINPTGAGGIRTLILVETVAESLRHLEGMNVAEIAERLGKHPVDALLDVVVEDDLRATFQTPERPTDVNAMSQVANSPFALPGLSDGGAHTKFSTIGGYGTVFLAEHVRRHAMMSLEDAHWRLSRYPAQAAGLLGRGCLVEGAPADVLVYDYEALEVGPEEKVHDFPGGEWRRIRKASGYRYTIVNGEVTFEDGACTGATPGSLLRHGRAEGRS